MSVSSHKLGPGTLSLGAAGSTKEFGAQLTKAALTPSSDDGETLYVLSGDELQDDGEETWTLDGSLLQSFAATSLLKWCFDNSGETVPFTFRPATAEALTCTGKVLVRELAVGGDVKKRNTSDFSFKATEVAMTATTP